jgi:hypothetical protein
VEQKAREAKWVTYERNSIPSAAAVLVFGTYLGLLCVGVAASPSVFIHCVTIGRESFDTNACGHHVAYPTYPVFPISTSLGFGSRSHNHLPRRVGASVHSLDFVGAPDAMATCDFLSISYPDSSELHALGAGGQVHLQTDLPRVAVGERSVVSIIVLG